MANFPHRLPHLSLLRGNGIEIGALHEPSAVGDGAQVVYVDTHTKEESLRLFPELKADQLVTPVKLVNLDAGELNQFAPASMDFVIASHVLEHLANPVFAVEQIFTVLRPHGIALLAIPDKNFTFDRMRGTTSFGHLWQDYLDRVTENSDEHYLDFLRGTAPQIFDGPPENIANHLSHVRGRHEHSHVWSSETFHEFMFLVIPLLGFRARLLTHSAGEQNGHEYFGMWEKL
jgi:SAM-dependent methyltransferase